MLLVSRNEDNYNKIFIDYKIYIFFLLYYSSLPNIKKIIILNGKSKFHIIIQTKRNNLILKKYK